MREKISIFGLCLIVLASCAFYTELVVWGVRIFEFPLLHDKFAKSLVVKYLEFEFEFEFEFDL